MTFADVTVATGDLYALMRALRDNRTAASPDRDSRRRALLATVPGADHGLGITIAADLLRKAGWEIDFQIGRDHGSPVAHAERTGPKVTGLSVSTGRRLEELPSLVVAIRLTVPDAVIGGAPGASFDHTQVTDLDDINLVFRDAQSAIGELIRPVRLQG